MYFIGVISSMTNLFSPISVHIKKGIKKEKEVNTALHK